MADYDIIIRAQDKTGRTLNKVEKRLDGLEKSSGAVTKALGAAGAALAAFATGGALSGVISTYTAFEKYRTVLAVYTGSQAKANAELNRLQKLANALPQDLQDITQSFVLFKSRGLDTSTKALTAFSNIATANGKSLTQLGEAVADALTGEFERLKEFGIKVSKENDQFVADIGNGQKILAASTTELVNKLQQLGEEGGKFGNAAAENAGTLAQNLSNLRGAAFEASVAFGEGAAPGLKTFSQVMTATIRANKDMIQSLGELVGSFGVKLAQAMRLVISLADEIRIAFLAYLALSLTKYTVGLAMQFTRLAGSLKLAGAAAINFNRAAAKNIIGVLVTAGFVIADMTGSLDGLYKKLGLMGDAANPMDGLTERLQDLNNQIAEMNEQTPERSLLYVQAQSTAKVLGPLTDKLKTQLEIESQRLKMMDLSNDKYVDQVALVNELSARYQSANNAMTQFNGTQAILIGVTAEANDALEEQNEELKKAEALLQSRKDDYDALFEYNQALDDSARLAKKYGLSEEEVTNILLEKIRAIQGIEDKAVETAEVVEDKWKQMGDTMSRSIAEAVADGKFTFSSFTDYLKQWAREIMVTVIQKMLVQPMTDEMAKLAGSISGSLSGAIGGALSGGGGGGGLGGLVGGIVEFGSNLFGGGKAMGGPVSGGTTYLVGEEGPELFTPGASGNITPNHELGGPSVNITIQAIDTQTGTEFLIKNKKQIEGIIQSAYNRQGKTGIY